MKSSTHKIKLHTEICAYTLVLALIFCLKCIKSKTTQLLLYFCFLSLRLYLLVKLFGGVEVAEFSSKLNPSERQKTLKDFEQGKIQLYVCLQYPLRVFRNNQTQLELCKAIYGVCNGEILLIFFHVRLISTDAAARGIDVNGVKCVINYDAPQYIRAYIHRQVRIIQ